MKRTVFTLTVVMAVVLGSGAGHAAVPAKLGDGTRVPSLAPMVDDVAPAVVNIAIRTPRSSNPLRNDPFFRRFFNVPEQRRQRQSTSAGSGVIIDADRGHILTNHHVIKHGKTIRVSLTDGRTLDAEVVGSDSQVDIALLRVDADNLTEVPMAEPDSLRVGDFVVAIGNPFGLGQTVTSGIVSALGRSGLGIHRYEDFIQTDASINPGNSGGPLVNLRGELVGINSAILAPKGGNVGIGFAIPTDVAVAIKDQLLEHGEVRRGSLGIIIQNLTPDLAQALGAEKANGVVVSRVELGSVAEDAGVRSGDIIVRANGKKVKNVETLRNLAGLALVGRTLTLEVVRDGNRRKLETVIDEPESDTLAGKELHSDLSGIVFAEKIDPSTAQLEGIHIAEIDRNSEAYKSGLREGDQVIAINRRKATSLESLRRIEQARGDILLRMKRGNRVFNMVIR